MPKDLSSQQVGTQRRAPATEPKTRVLTGLTKFPMSYKHANTARYGHITPFYYQHSRGDDTVPLFSEHELRTYTLSSPMLSDLNMNKTYFMVDMEAIYPRNWNLMLVNPSKGDDVPDDTRAVVKNMFYYIRERHNRFITNFTSADFPVNVNNNSYLTLYIRYILFLESIFSSGSLFSEFDIHLQPFLEYAISATNKESFDFWFDNNFASELSSLELEFQTTEGGHRYKIWDEDKIFIDSEEMAGLTLIPVRRALEIMRENSFSIVDYNDEELPAFYSKFIGLYLVNTDPITEVDFDFENYPINLEIILGYQLGCSQFFTDSHIDYIYSADLYRKAVESLYTSIDDLHFFDYNGNNIQYDVLSGHYISIVLQYLAELPSNSPILSSVFDYFSLLFSHRHSLRYGDYFVTGRPNPLGIGDVQVDTSQASVSVVDITRNIQYQRFLNAVNITGQKIGEYAKGVLGLDDAGDIGYDVPAFLGHKTLPIRGMEVENTGSEQREANSITTILRSSNNTHAFELRTKRPCIIYGVYSFDVARIYSKTFDRMHMHENRFDDFIPQMQYVGDQPIYKRELNSLNAPDGVFAYSLRYMEYKIRHHYASGGAIEALPSWFFITDGISGDPLEGQNINPDYIRSKPTEFDRFYSSLTGYSLGTYFHFIVMTTNHQELTRKMDYAPEPLK